MQKHLNKIKSLLEGFLKPFNFNKSYFEISGAVSADTHTRLKIKCMDEFDDLTVAQVKKIRSDAYDIVRQYLEDNDIEDTIYIEPTCNQKYYSGFQVCYKMHSTN